MLHLVTVATHSERYLPVLEKQAEDNGVKLVKLGMGKEYPGHYIKDLEMIEYLKKIDENDIVTFVDGFDSLMLAHKDEIVKKFNETEAELLLSVENIGFLNFIHSAVFERVKGKFLNTGLYMGRAGFLLKFLEDMYSIDYNKKSNQKTWCSYLFKLQHEKKFDGIKLDTESKLFLNYSFTTSDIIKYKDKRIILKNNINPCFIQGNGCEDMTYIINGNGYKDYNKHQNDFWRKKISYQMTSIFKTYNPILTFYIYLIIIVAGLVLYFSYRYYKSRKNDYFYLSL